MFFAFWMLVVVGVTQVVCVSLLFKPIREWHYLPSIVQKMLRCTMCFSVWAGFGLSLLGFGPTSHLFIEWPMRSGSLLDAFAASAVAWLAHNVLNALGASKL